MSKQSAFMKAVQKEVNTRLRQSLKSGMQLAEDAAFIAANEVLGLGAGRAKEFGNAFVKYVNEIAEFVVADSKDDKDIAYSKEILDRRIKAIVGEENFVPYDERYGG